MVAKISTPRRISAALNYNEQKVQKGKAEFLLAMGYLRDATDMNFYQKLEVLEMRSALNTRATTKFIHVSLNFDPSEDLSREKLLSIAERYMEGIGFTNQPYLVYQHHDAGHPHLHLVASAIREDGTRINLHNLGKGLSEKTRQEIEKEFGLVQASRKQSAPVSLSSVKTAIYGQQETKRAMESAVHFVRQQYCFHSLAQFNACLRLLGVQANGGKEGSRIAAHKGLRFELLDAQGRPVGVPLKASRLSGKPTLKNLEADFIRHKARKPNLIANTKEKVQCVLSAHPQNLQQFTDALHAQNILVVLHRSSEGKLYGITYIDQGQKAVFNGSELGKAFRAAAIHKQIEAATNHAVPLTQVSKAGEEHTSHPGLTPIKGKHTDQAIPGSTVLQALWQPEHAFEPANAPGLQKKRKRKKQRPKNF